MRTSNYQAAQLLAERVSLKRAQPGTLVGWRTPAGQELGVVVGHDGQDLLVSVTYDRSLKSDKRVKFYRDEELSSRVPGPGVPGVVRDIHRVPAKKAFVRGRMAGAAARPYVQLGVDIQEESVKMPGASPVPKVGDTFKWRGKQLTIFSVTDKVKDDDVVIVQAGQRGGGKGTYYLHRSSGKWMDSSQHKRMKAKEGHGYARRSPNLPQDMMVYKGESLKSQHRELLRKAYAKQGVTKLRPIDPEEYPPIRGMEGPFQMKIGRNWQIVYYDPREGKYYDRKTDMYLKVESEDAVNSNINQKLEAIRLRLQERPLDLRDEVPNLAHVESTLKDWERKWAAFRRKALKAGRRDVAEKAEKVEDVMSHLRRNWAEAENSTYPRLGQKG